jgi:hypothetical protein
MDHPARRRSRSQHVAVFATCALLLSQQFAQAGGFLFVGGPTFGISGQPFIWDPAAMPVKYRVDPGPLSKRPDGTIAIDNSTGLARVKAMFDVWQNVPTANISYSNAGNILPAGSYVGGPVGTVQHYTDVFASCDAGTQSPVVFDADGSIFAGLGLPSSVIGFAGACKLGPVNGRIVSGGAALNGRFQDGVSGPQLTVDEFNQAFTHEFGHFSGLDHSQINVDVFAGQPGACDLNSLAGLPLMFPFLFCQARTSVGLPPLAPDDIAWISRLYPVTGAPPPGKSLTSSAYGTISGKVLFTDGITQAQGVNVIARQVESPRSIAVSVVSGYLFTGNAGQTVTCQDPSNPTPTTCGNLGSQLGSHDPALIGHYEIPLPPGNYTVEVESVFDAFVGGSSLGPLDPPIPVPGTFAKTGPISVSAGAMVLQDITLQGTPQRFDAFENAALQPPDAPIAWLRREDFLAEKRRA